MVRTSDELTLGDQVSVVSKRERRRTDRLKPGEELEVDGSAGDSQGRFDSQPQDRATLCAAWDGDDIRDGADIRSMLRCQQTVVLGRGDPVPLDYRLEKTPNGWKVYDMNIMGVWLVEAYRNQFSNQISQNGIEGLVKFLQDRNKQLAAAKPAN